MPALPTRWQSSSTTGVPLSEALRTSRPTRAATADLRESGRAVVDWPSQDGQTPSDDSPTAVRFPPFLRWAIWHSEDTTGRAATLEIAARRVSRGGRTTGRAAADHRADGGDGVVWAARSRCFMAWHCSCRWWNCCRHFPDGERAIEQSTRTSFHDMAIYHYQAIDATGQLVTGELEAASVQQALVELESRGLTVQSIGLDSAFATPQESQSAGDRHAVSGPLDRRRHRKATCYDPTSRRFSNAAKRSCRRSRRTPRSCPGRQRGRCSPCAGCWRAASSEQATAALVESPEYWIPLLSAATFVDRTGTNARLILV